MKKQYFSILAFATLLCVMLFGIVSCKKDDIDAKGFFIDVDFLPESETNGEVAPRLVVNFNDEAAMIELRRPSNSDPMESVLFLYPDNKTMMMCGNDSLMICAEYNLETYTPSHDVLIVTQMEDNSLLLTKGFMNWSTNTLTTSDMMVLPINGTSRDLGKRGDSDGDIRVHYFNNFIKPLTESLEQVEDFYSFFPVPQKIVITCIRAIIATTAPVALFSDDPDLFVEAMGHPITMGTAQSAQTYLLNLFPRKYGEVASRILAVIGWSKGGGHGKVDDYTGEETDDFSYATFWGQSSNAAESAGQLAIHPPAYIVNLNVSNITENSAYLRGRFQYISSITPVETGYIFKIGGGPEYTEHDMNFQGITLSGLQKASKYTAFAYAKSAFGDRVLSPGVNFWTLGFEAFPTTLTFPTEGDTKYVGLCYSHDDITSWDITSKPSWCSTTIDDLGLLAVTVGASTESRSGAITIKAHSNVLGTITENLEVTQLGANGWDGTAWVFTGRVTTNDFEGHTTSEEITLTLMVNSVSNNDIMFSWAEALSVAANNGYSDNYVLNGNGNLVYSATAGYSGNWGSNHITSQVTFTRTGSTTATANLNYRETFSNYFTTVSGTLQGTLVNAKEIGEYETTIHLRVPAFENIVPKGN